MNAKFKTSCSCGDPRVSQLGYAIALIELRKINLSRSGKCGANRCTSTCREGARVNNYFLISFKNNFTMIWATILTEQVQFVQYSTSVSLSFSNMSGLFRLRSSTTENSKHKNASFTFVQALLNKRRFLEQQEIQDVNIFCFCHMETSSELLRFFSKGF